MDTSKFIKIYHSLISLDLKKKTGFNLYTVSETITVSMKV